MRSPVVLRRASAVVTLALPVLGWHAVQWGVRGAEGLEVILVSVAWVGYGIVGGAMTLLAIGLWWGGPSTGRLAVGVHLAAAISLVVLLVERTTRPAIPRPAPDIAYPAGGLALVTLAAALAGASLVVGRARKA